MQNISIKDMGLEKWWEKQVKEAKDLAEKGAKK